MISETINQSPVSTKAVAPFRILSLDGGGAKGFYTLGILEEIEAMTEKRLYECFDLIYGTSTGAIIAALLARGEKATDVRSLYEKHVPDIMKGTNAKERSEALRSLAHTVFENQTYEVFKTRIGIVATNWQDERPKIFKILKDQAFGSKGSFVPFWGCTVADAVIASCSAYPFFDRHTVKTSTGDSIELGDGGFCANNPTLYALCDATGALKLSRENLRVVSLGVGSYPEPSFLKKVGRIRGGWGMIRHGFNSDFLQKILGTNTCSMEVLRSLMFKDVPTIRISDSFVEPAMATDLLEHDLNKLNRLVQKGRLSFSEREDELKSFLL
ncbi:MAG: patatin-like phospholipase family protein [Verrucomicrobiia bacterium]